MKAAQRGQVTGLTTRLASEAPTEPWADVGKTAHSLLDLVRPTEPAYARFPKGAVGRANAILQFANLVSQSARAYLADPWFDLKGAEDLLLRVRGDAKFTILTNLPGPSHAADVQALSVYLDKASALGLPQNLEVVCLCGSRPAKQIFHDRFLLLETEGRWRGFVLTNSFSGLASEYALYVVEAPLRTTALLLEEFERLLALENVTYEKVWPPQPAEGARTIRSPDRFDGDVGFVCALVPGRFRSHQDRLRVATARGLLLLTPNGTKWRMTPSGRDQFMRWFLGSRARPFRLKGKPRNRVRLRAAQTQPGRRPFGLGKAILVLGELVARGCDLGADLVAARLEARSAFAIELALRDGFSEDPDPTKLTAGSSHERLAIRQSLATTFPRQTGIRSGMSLWNASLHIFERRPPWDRCYAYAVLAYLDPERAVRLCEELLDADFVLALVGHLTRCADAWSYALAVALLRSRAATLRGLGAQALAHGSLNGPISHKVAAPSDTALAIANLRSAGAEVEEIALCVSHWGIASQPPVTQALAIVLAELAGEVQPPFIEDLAALLMEEEHRVEVFLGALVPTLSSSQAASASNLLRALVHNYAKKFIGALSDNFMFGDIDAPLVLVMAKAVVALANQAGTSPSALIRHVADVSRLEATLVPPTPFRPRAGAMGAEVAYGWTLLWELVAASSPPDDKGLAAVPAGAVERVRAYLGTRELGQSGALRKLMSKLIISVPADAPEVP